MGSRPRVSSLVRGGLACVACALVASATAAGGPSLRGTAKALVAPHFKILAAQDGHCVTSPSPSCADVAFSGLPRSFDRRRAEEVAQLRHRGWTVTEALLHAGDYIQIERGPLRGTVTLFRHAVGTCAGLAPAACLAHRDVDQLEIVRTS